KSLQVSRAAAFTATRAIAATTIRTGSRSGSAAKSGVSPRPSAARCVGAPPSNPSSATSRRITAWAATISPAAMAIALTPCSPLPATTFSLLLHWFEELLRVLSLILCHALLAGPLHLTRCRKTFFTADDEVAKLLKIAIRSIDDEALQRQY